MLPFSTMLLLYLSYSTLISAQQQPLSLSLSQQSPNKLSDREWQELLQLHRKLVEHESTTGNEKSVGNWLANYLQEQGLRVEKQRVSTNRFNVLAYPGTSPKTSILITSHIDTVPPYIPYSLHNGNKEIRGRGTVDAKASVAAQITAAMRIINGTRSHSLSPPSLSLLFVVGEEKGGEGMRAFSCSKPTNYSAVVFGEPTEGKLATGHKGMLSFSLNITGKAAHSGYPWLGVSATDLLVDAMQALKELRDRLPADKDLGPTTLNIGKFEGGVAANVVAASASADVSIRVAAGSPQTIEDLVTNALEHVKQRAVSAGGGFELKWNPPRYGAVHLDSDVPGFDTMAVNYGTDIPNLEGDHKRYLYGPGSIHVAHGSDEHLTTGDLEFAVLGYEMMLYYLLDRL